MQQQQQQQQQQQGQQGQQRQQRHGQRRRGQQIHHQQQQTQQRAHLKKMWYSPYLGSCSSRERCPMFSSVGRIHSTAFRCCILCAR